MIFPAVEKKRGPAPVPPLEAPEAARETSSVFWEPLARRGPDYGFVKDQDEEAPRPSKPPAKGVES
jgi:hypothetical protein